MALVFVLLISALLSAGDFPICTVENTQCYPEVIFAESKFCVFWSDYRYMAAEKYSIYGSRVSTTGTVLDPDGKLLFENYAAQPPAAAYDGANFLVVFRDSC